MVRNLEITFSFLADSAKQFRFGALRDVMRDGKSAMRTRAFRMHNTLRKTLAVEMLQLLDQMKILQQERAVWASGGRVLVIGYRNARGGG